MPRLPVLLAIALLLVSPALAVDVFPLDQLQPGMEGVGYTVFSGDSVESFPVRIVDLLPGGAAGRDLVLVQALGERFESGGISQGMSGSPVYIDGKWLGALAYAFSFNRESQVMLTPAADMLSLADYDDETARSEGVIHSLPLGKGERRALELGGAIYVSGMGDASLTELADELGLACAVLPMGGRTKSAMNRSSTLKPGSAVAVEILRGPISMSAVGTVSHVEGDQVWAFGHAFLDEGAVRLPMASAWVHGVISSLNLSHKMASPAASIGTLHQDRIAGVYGRLGESPAMLPLALEIEIGDGKSERFDFEVARHRALLSPALRAATRGLLRRSVGRAASGDLALELDLHLEGRTVHLSDRFSGQGLLPRADNWLAALISGLQQNAAGPLPLDSLNLGFRWRGDVQEVLLDAFRCNHGLVAAGSTLPLSLAWHQGGKKHREKLTFELPASLPPGKYKLHLADGGSFQHWNRKRQPGLYRFDDHDDLLRVLNLLEPSDSWLIWLEGSGNDPVLGGHETRLPGSLRTLAGLTGSGSKEASRLLALSRLAAPAQARGHLTLSIVIDPSARRIESE